MSRFSIHNRYFIVVICLVLAVIGVTGVVRMRRSISSHHCRRAAVDSALDAGNLLGFFHAGKRRKHEDTGRPDAGLLSRDRQFVSSTAMAMKLGTRAEQHTPMARAISGLTSSFLLATYLVPAAYLLVYQRRSRQFVQA